MIDVIVFAIASLVVGLVAIYGRSAWMRTAGYAGLIAAVLVLWFAAMGLPRPAYLPVPNGTILSYSLDEPRAIYLWLVPEGSTQPLALKLPWHEDVASNLVNTDRRRTNAGDTLKITGNPGNDIGMRAKPIFYVSHVQGLPPKQTQR
jgi:hypothetical protein